MVNSTISSLNVVLSIKTGNYKIPYRITLLKYKYFKILVKRLGCNGDKQLNKSKVYACSFFRVREIQVNMHINLICKAQEKKYSR